MPNDLILQAIYALRALNPDVLEEGGDDKSLRQLSSSCTEIMQWIEAEQTARAELRAEARGAMHAH